MLTEVAEAIRTIFNAPDRVTADEYLARAVKEHEKRASRLSEWIFVTLHLIVATWVN